MKPPSIYFVSLFVFSETKCQSIETQPFFVMRFWWSLCQAQSRNTTAPHFAKTRSTFLAPLWNQLCPNAVGVVCCLRKRGERVGGGGAAGRQRGEQSGYALVLGGALHQAAQSASGPCTERTRAALHTLMRSSHGQGGRQLVRLQATRLPSLPVPGGVSFFLFFYFLLQLFLAGERARVCVCWRESWTRARKLNAVVWLQLGASPDAFENGDLWPHIGNQFLLAVMDGILTEAFFARAPKSTKSRITAWFYFDITPDEKILVNFSKTVYFEGTKGWDNKKILCG